MEVVGCGLGCCESVLSQNVFVDCVIVMICVERKAISLVVGSWMAPRLGWSLALGCRLVALLRLLR